MQALQPVKYIHTCICSHNFPPVRTSWIFRACWTWDTRQANRRKHRTKPNTFHEGCITCYLFMYCI